MIKALLILVLLIATPALFAQSAKDEIIHIVYDLDWTLINKGPNSRSPSKQLITVNNEKYFISELAQKVITEQLKNPKVRISFYSGGEAQRNVKALKKIKLTDGSGRSLYDISHKVLSKKHLHQTGLPETAKFAERFKKDMTLVTPNLDNVVLVDDLAIFSLQDGKLLHLGRTYSIFETYGEAEKAFALNPKDKFIPTRKPDWILDRYKIAAAHGIIDEAMKLTKKGMTFSEAVQKLASEPREKYLYLGLEKLKMGALARELRRESFQRKEKIQKMRTLFKLPRC